MLFARSIGVPGPSRSIIGVDGSETSMISMDGMSRLSTGSESWPFDSMATSTSPGPAWAAPQCSRPCMRFDLPEPGSPRMPTPPYSASGASEAISSPPSRPRFGPPSPLSASGAAAFAVRDACESADGVATPARAPAGNGMLERWNA